jgi:repressor LexA
MDARLSKNMSLRDLAREAGLDHTYINRLEKGEAKKPSRSAVLKLVRAVNAPETLWLIAAGYVPFNNNHYAVNDISEPEDIVKTADIIMLPVLGTIPAGKPIIAAENIVDYAPADARYNKDCFYLLVKGDSMIGSRIHEGDLVLVRKQDYVGDGQIAVVIINGEEATLKRIYQEDGGYFLQADNPKYPPRYVSRDNLIVVGVVLSVQFKPN